MATNVTYQNTEKTLHINNDEQPIQPVLMKNFLSDTYKKDLLRLLFKGFKRSSRLPINNPQTNLCSLYITPQVATRSIYPDMTKVSNEGEKKCFPLNNVSLLQQECYLLSKTFIYTIFLLAPKHEEATFLKFIFVFIPYFIGAIWTYGDGCPRMKLWGTPTLMGHSCKDFHSLMLRDAEGWPEILLSF